MKLALAGDQHVRHFTFSADSTTTGAAQLVLPEHSSRSFLMFQNNSPAPLFFGFGSGRATCTIAAGKVNAVTVTNPGFNFSRAPRVHFLGGGYLAQQGIYPANTSYVGAAGPGFPSPSHRALAHCVMAGAAPNMTIASIAIDDPGANYIVAPYVQIINDELDPNGCFDPSFGGGSGPQLAAFQQMYLSHSAVTTDPLAIFGGAGNAFSCLWMP